MILFHENILEGQKARLILVAKNLKKIIDYDKIEFKVEEDYCETIILRKNDVEITIVARKEGYFTIN